MRSAYEQSQTSLLEVLLARRLAGRRHQPGRLPADHLRAGPGAGRRDPRSARSCDVKQDTLQRGAGRRSPPRGRGDEQAKALAERQAELGASRSELAAPQGRRGRRSAPSRRPPSTPPSRRRATLPRRSSRTSGPPGDARSTGWSPSARRSSAKRLAEEEAARGAPPAAVGGRLPLAGGRLRASPRNGARPPSCWSRRTPTSGVYYPHFHGGIDIADRLRHADPRRGSGSVVASGQPLWPWDSGYGVVISHGGGVQTWYWHLTAQVIVQPGQRVGTAR